MNEKTYGDFLLEYAKREFVCAKFDDTKLSVAMLNFLEEAAKFTNNEPDNIKKLINILNLLVDMHPIVPITEDDFVEEIYKEDDKPYYKIMRCTRYKYIYKTEDGRYWNDRAIGFRKVGQELNNIFFIYQGNLGSKQEIKLPYYPETIIKTIDTEHIKYQSSFDNTNNTTNNFPDYEVE
jgi:hypothetical protein